MVYGPLGSLLLLPLYVFSDFHSPFYVLHSRGDASLVHYLPFFNIPFIGFFYFILPLTLLLYVLEVPYIDPFLGPFYLWAL